MTTLVGRTIRDYTIHEQIATTANATVYKATHPKIKQPVCIKVLTTRNLADDEMLIRFEREARAIAGFNHVDEIVPLYDYWREADGAYLVLKYLGGGTLKHMLADTGALPLKTVLSIFDRLTTALEAAHRKQIVHRDVKPSNVLFDDKGKAYLADFGIVRYKDSDLTKPRSVLGTPAYLSPEQIRTAAITPQTDIYALGLILYECVTGERPFPVPNAVQVMLHHMQTPVPEVTLDNPKRTRILNEVIQGATQKDPADRFASVADMWKLLRKAG